MNQFTKASLYFYAVAVGGFGVIMLVVQNFLTGLLPVPAGVPLRGVLWVLTSAVFILAAAAVVLGFRRQLALVAIGVVFLLYLFGLHLPALFANIYNGGNWAATFEVIMLSGGAFILAAQAADDPGFGLRGERAVRMAAVAGHYAFAAALFLFAIQHIMYFDYIVSLMPVWLPFKIGWAYLVIAGYILCGVSFVIGQRVGLSALWLGIMFGLWVVILHAPRAIGKWSVESEWTSLFVALAVCGAAFSISRRGTVRQPDALIVLPRV